MNRAFILGAGFSKAIHSRMPLLNELTTGVRGVLPDDLGHDLDAIGDVESWLTLLADPLRG